MEKWFVINKGADFEKLGKKFGISPVTARLIRNREVIGEAAFDKYLNGSLKDLYDPHLLKDADVLTDILKKKIEEKKPIRIIGDYDIDGVMSTYILYQGITRCGGNVSTQIPDRMKDGYGINENLIDQAKKDGMDKGNNLAFHLIQSFKLGEIDAETAHRLGQQFADEVLKI